MTKCLLALCAVTLPAVALAQVNSVGPFTGTYSDGFETYASNFYNTLPVFGGNATMTSIGGGQGMLVTTGWSFYEFIGPHSGNQFMGGAESNYEITFSVPAVQFGAYFATNSNVPDGTATFYDANGNQIGAPLNVSAPLGQWAWDGWSYSGGIKTIVFTADNSFGGFLDIDDMQFNPPAAPEPCTLAALGLGAMALLRRRSKG